MLGICFVIVDLRCSQAKCIYITSVFHHLPSSVQLQLCALSHLGCTRKVVLLLVTHNTGIDKIIELLTDLDLPLMYLFSKARTKKDHWTFSKKQTVTSNYKYIVETLRFINQTGLCFLKVKPRNYSSFTTA